MKKLLNFDYACIHGTYWMYYGIVSSFASVFLLTRGYSNSEIGVTLAVANVLAVVLQPLIADLADRVRRVSVIAITEVISVMMMVVTAGLFAFKGKTLALSVIFILLIAWHTVLQPLINSLAFRLEESGVHINFGMTRSMGSLAYSALVAVLGTLVENHGIGVLPITGEIVLVMLIVSLILTKRHYDKAKALNDKTKVLNDKAKALNDKADSLNDKVKDLNDKERSLNDGERGEMAGSTGSPGNTETADAAVSYHRADRPSQESVCYRGHRGEHSDNNSDNIRDDNDANIGMPSKDEETINLVQFIKNNRLFFVVNIGVIGLFFSNSILNNYMMQIVSVVGGNSEDMGRILSVMAFLEIPTMVCFDMLRKKLTCQFMLKIAAIGFTVKIGICYIATSVAMVFIAQLFQLVSFALFLPAMVHFIDETMRKGEAIKGQALFTTMITVTTVFSSLVGGVILDASGAKMLTLVATLATAAGAAIVIAVIDKV